MPVLKFIKKPVIIEAIHWNGDNAVEVIKFFKDNRSANTFGDINNGVASIVTLEGTMVASVGDWIIKGVSGELYPCKPDIFNLTYEQVD